MVDALDLILARLLIHAMLEVILVDFALNKLLNVFVNWHSAGMAILILNKTRAEYIILKL